MIFGNYDIYYMPKPDPAFRWFIKKFKNKRLLVSSIEGVITNTDNTTEDYWHKGYMIQNMYDVFAISDCIAESIEQYYGKRTVVLPLGVRE